MPDLKRIIDEALNFMPLPYKEPGSRIQNKKLIQAPAINRL
jgi:hypothetical protein